PRWTAARPRSRRHARSWPRRRSSRWANGCARSGAARCRRRMASVDVPVALLGYGTVGAAVNRLLNEQADDIERATGHRLRVVKALVPDLSKERSWPAPDGVLTTSIEEILDDPSITVIAEVMGGVEPTGGYV